MKLRTRDGYWLCREINEKCVCGRLREYPCESIRIMLVSSQGDPVQALKSERARIEDNLNEG